jgi:hypothetical protein
MINVEIPPIELRYPDKGDRTPLELQCLNIREMYTP